MSDDQHPQTPATSSADAPDASPDTPTAAPAAAAKKTAAKKAAAKKTTAKKATAKKTTAKKASATKDAAADPAALPETSAAEAQPTDETAARPKKKAASRPRKKAAAPTASDAAPGETSTEPAQTPQRPGAPAVLFKAPEATTPAPRKRATAKPKAQPAEDDERPIEPPADSSEGDDSSAETTGEAGDETGDDGSTKRRPRRRGGRRRRKSGDGSDSEGDEGDSTDDAEHSDHSEQAGGGDGGDASSDDGNGETGSRRRRTRTRTPRNPEDEIASVSGSTRLEAKKQRRREGREAGRRRAPIVSEAEFLARRESVERVMVIRQRDDLTQIAVLEDKVLVEHYVSRESQTSLIGNVYLGRVQNVLPSMEAAFIDIGKGRNAVLYAGEVNWAALGHKDGQPRKIESVLSSGQTILVQVTKDPIGHKGARLTGQISIPGRFLVYVPDGTTSGISRKLPDTERNRLKTLLKEIVPDTAGVIVRTAAEGASEDELTLDVERLTSRWSDIEAKVKAGKGPELLYGEPDLTLKVVRDLFTEDFSKLVIDGEEAWNLVQGYVSQVAPDLEQRLERFAPGDGASKDVFASYRVDEQIAKGLDRKVWLPSGGSLVIDRTEAMTVVDVNTGKFTGSGGNLEETVTKNNLEAAEEIVRQLRLRDIGGIIVVDFIDMVLESNRDLVLRRLVECLGRDRTRHQVAEVTSLGLVQMTRKRIGTGLLEAFSEECTHCKGRGVVVHEHPIETAGASAATDDEPRGRRSRGGRGRARQGGDQSGGGEQRAEPVKPSPKDLAGSRPHPADELAEDDQVTETAPDAASPAEVPAEVPAELPAEASPQVPAATADEGSDAVVAEPRPVVVSSTRRRRTATRPAGPPAADAASEPVAEPMGGAALDQAPVEDVAADALEDQHLAEDLADDALTELPEEALESFETGTEGPDGAESADGADSAESADETDPDAFVPHVPVKKKGVRKR